jgi:hypothetical protein
MTEQWWYLKMHRSSSGVLGRPRRPVPLTERQRLARQKCCAKLTAQGVCVVRLSMTTVDAERLRAFAEAQKSGAIRPGKLTPKLLPCRFFFVNQPVIVRLF